MSMLSGYIPVRGYRGGAEMSGRIYSPLSLIAVSWLHESTLVSRLLRIPFFCDLCYSLRVLHHAYKGAAPMEWTTPQHEEIDLNCEISSYANAEL